ncbi:hypothetical protein P8C59_003125 [Phyllachora maydis]|uniref:Uncharacterized protein n=1 Tax=Phyllachora maydis TaxID=1825666 RepID=A0AAD9MD06_9PEZI|nr:hypothetical protein P8C59_003125 [Phyllachora maydis]
MKFIKDNTVLSQPINHTALKGELVDLDLDLEGAISPDPSNLNTKRPISIEIRPSKLEPYESSSNSKLDKPLLDKPINPYLNSTKDYSICFSYNGNTVADLGPKLSNSSNTTTKLSRDFHSKEGPRPLTTTSTTIVDSRNGKDSSRASIIISSLVSIGFSNSDFTGDKATSKSTYGYLYKLAEAIREVQDNQGSKIVANNPALYARTKYTLLKFQYVREQVEAKIVTIIYLNTKFNSTGYFTAL